MLIKFNRFVFNNFYSNPTYLGPRIRIYTKLYKRRVHNIVKESGEFWRCEVVKWIPATREYGVFKEYYTDDGLMMEVPNYIIDLFSDLETI